MLKIDLDPFLWTIACPGPSLNHVIRGVGMMHYYPGHLIAVNSAILCACPFSYWAIMDIELFELLMKQVYGPVPEVALWTAARWDSDILRYPHLVPVNKKFDKIFYPCAQWEDLANMMPFGKDLNWRSFCMFTAVALAILRGARKIKLYGADMAGPEHYVNGYETSRDFLTPARWKIERDVYESIRAACIENNIIITREELYDPEGDTNTQTIKEMNQ